ncbi:MAG: hypothetical protein QOH17_4794 [Pseudonocardiales bacterium]|jgi:hypothetical protein|nr:hypothetical protein [Pseudonocardiales bacterium]
MLRGAGSEVAGIPETLRGSAPESADPPGISGDVLCARPLRRHAGRPGGQMVKPPRMCRQLSNSSTDTLGSCRSRRNAWLRLPDSGRGRQQSIIDEEPSSAWLQLAPPAAETRCRARR